MNRPLVSVTGASGGLGQALVPRLLENHRVRALFRQRTELSRRWESAGCEVVEGDLGNAAALAALVRDASCVVHAAARILGFSRTAFEATNVDGTRRLAEASAAAGVKRFVHLSSIAVYGGVAPGPDGFTEDLGTQGPGLEEPYGWSKRQAETAVRQALTGTATEWVILRPTCIYGPGMESWTLLPLRSIERGRTLMLGLDEGHGRLDVVHVDDVVRGVLAAMARGGIGGQAYNLGGASMTFREFYDALGAMVGKTPRLGRRSGLERFHRVVSRGVRWSGGRGKPLLDGLQLLLDLAANQAAYPSIKAQRELGYVPSTSWCRGWLETELSVQAKGMLKAGRRRLWNADRHYCLRPAAVAQPRTTEEVAEVLAVAAERGLPVKAIGSLHSFAPLPETEGVVVALDRCANPVSIDGPHATVQAGMTIAGLNRHLAGHGLALPGHGSHTAQTIAGAISTGTHGGALRLGTVADFVEAVQLVRVDGTVMNLRRGQPGFEPAVVSLGVLGIVTEVTLRCVPRFALEAVAQVLPIDQVIEDFDRLQRGNEFVELLYHPCLEEVEVLVMNRVPTHTVPAAAPAPAKPPSPAQRRAVSTVLKSVLGVLRRTDRPGLHQYFARKLMGTSHRNRRGWSDAVLGFTDLDAGEPFPIDDLEFAVPYASTVQALKDLRALFRSGPRPRFFPVHLRCSAAGEQWLGPNQGRETTWIEFWCHPADPSLYRSLHGVLAAHQARWHWGKILTATPDEVRRAYPRWDAFAALRREWDPEGRLLNAHTRPWFT